MIPAWLTYLVCGVGAMSLVGLFVIALCRVAKDADEMLDEHADRQLAEVLHFDCERRTHGDVRNGAGEPPERARVAARAARDERRARQALSETRGRVAVSTIDPPRRGVA